MKSLQDYINEAIELSAEGKKNFKKASDILVELIEKNLDKNDRLEGPIRNLICPKRNHLNPELESAGFEFDSGEYKTFNTFWTKGPKYNHYKTQFLVVKFNGTFMAIEVTTSVDGLTEGLNFYTRFRVCKVSQYHTPGETFLLKEYEG